MENRKAFWSLVIERLGIRFQRPFTRVADLSPGVETPRWLPGARLNIVESCFTAPPDSPAIIHQAEGAGLEVMSVGRTGGADDRVAVNLKRRGIRPGDALAMILPMSAECVAIYLGIIKAGGVVVGIADSLPPKEIATRLRLAQAAARCLRRMWWCEGAKRCRFTLSDGGRRAAGHRAARTDTGPELRRG